MGFSPKHAREKARRTPRPERRETPGTRPSHRRHTPLTGVARSSTVRVPERNPSGLAFFFFFFLTAFEFRNFIWCPSRGQSMGMQRPSGYASGSPRVPEEVAPPSGKECAERSRVRTVTCPGWPAPGACSAPAPQRSGAECVFAEAPAAGACAWASRVLLSAHRSVLRASPA